MDLAPSLDASIPAELVEAGASGHLVVLVGAGAGIAAGLPTWKELLTDLFQRARIKVLTPDEAKKVEGADASFGVDDLIGRASFLQQTLGVDWLANEVVAIVTPHEIPSPTHDALAEIEGAAFVTTNYDRLLETAIQKRSSAAPQVVYVTNANDLFNFSAGAVLKLHGDIADPSTIVLTTEDYFRVSYVGSGAWEQRLQALLQKPHALLLVGYGYGDVDVTHVVNKLRGAFQGDLPGPFWLTKRDVPAETKASASGLRPIWLEGHEGAPRWLRALAAAIEQKKRQSPVVVKTVAYARQLQQKYRDAQHAAGELFQRGNYSSAESGYRALLTDVQSLLPDDPANAELLRIGASTRANIGACLLCLQKNEEARAVLNQVADNESEKLDDDGRVLLAEALAQLGERNRVQALLDRADAGSTSKYLEVRQILGISDGHMPTGETNGLAVGLWMARNLAGYGKFTESYQIAVTVAARHDRHALVRLHATRIMVEALIATVHEQGKDATWIPLAQRGEAVELVEAALTWLDESLSESALVELLVQLKRSFYFLTQDDYRLSLLAPPDAATTTLNEPFALAQRLAREGKLQEALGLLEPVPNEWIASWERYYLRALSGDVSGAAEGAEALSLRFPDKAPLEYFLANLLRSAARFDDAVTHARAAFFALPGRGYRLLLARCLNGARRCTEASTLLQYFGESGGDAVLKARATSLEESEPNAAIDLWRQYLAVNPGDIAAQLTVSELLFGSGRRQDAAEHAWVLFESTQEQLEPAALYRCAQYQRLSDPLDAEARARVAEIGRVLASRQRADPAALSYRFMVDTMLDLQGAEAPDFAALVNAGVLQTLTLDEVAEHLRRRSSFHEQAYNIYRRAQLPFECLCELTHTPAAQYVAAAAEIAAAHGPAVLCAPAGLPQAPPLLSGQRLLVGELECLLLQHLGIFARLKDSLGRGKLVVFRDVRQRIVESAANVELGTQRVALQKESELLQFLKTHAKVEVTVADASTTDAAWSKVAGIPIVDTHVDPEFSPLSARALTERLSQLGKIEQTQTEALLAQFAHEDNGGLPLPEPLPDRVALGFVVLRALSDLEVLNAAIDLIPQRVFVGPATMALLEGRIVGLQRKIAGADLASATNRSIGEGIARGWIDATLKRPELSWLPEVGKPTEHDPLLYRDPIVKGYSFLEALANDADLWLLTADGFAQCPLGSHPDLVTKLSWPTPADFIRAGDRLRTASSRELRFPALVTAILSGAQLEKTLLQLLELGFPDALRAADVAALDVRFGGLQKDEPKRLLARAEVIARDRDHPLMPIATIGLAFTYANAIWQVFQREVATTAPRPEAAADVLLARMEALSDSALDLGLQAVGTVIASHPKLAFIVKGEASILSLESVAGRLWTHLHSFSQGGGLRRSSYARALRQLWLVLDEISRPRGPGRVRFAPLLLSIQVAPSNMLQPELDAAAILSANWEASPLRELTPTDSVGPDVEETLLKLAQRLLSDPAGIAVSSSELSEVPEIDAVSIVAVPPEAVLLRAAPEAATSLAGVLARLQGPHDGRAYTLLSSFASDPSDVVVRRDLARAAARAPWRFTRENPRSLASWGTVARYGDSAFPDSITELRALLSEPAHGVAEDEPLWKEIAGRVAEGGIWRGRADIIQLLHGSVGVPGVLPGASAEMRLVPERRLSELSGALKRLKRPDDQPATHLASDIFLMRFAAERDIKISVDGSDVDLREELPRLLRSIISACLGHADGGPKSETTETVPSAGRANMADAEAPILRVCLKVVQDLCQGNLIPLKQGLWLAYRLFEWFWLQLEQIPEARAAEAFSGFIATDTGARDLPTGVDDLLNPFCFSPDRFDHRLATILYAICAMDDLVRVFDAPEAGDPTLKPYEELEDLLIEIASRHPSPFEFSLRRKGEKPSCLDWYGTGAIPELALTALIKLRPIAFFRMDAATRMRWIQELATSSADKEHIGWHLSEHLIRILTIGAESLTSDERSIFGSRLRTLDAVAEPRASTLKLFGFTRLFAAGQKEVMLDAASLLSENLANKAAPILFELYIGAVAQYEVERTKAEAARIFEEAAALVLDLVPFAVGLAGSARSADGAAESALREALREVASRGALEGDERMAQLLASVDEPVGLS